MSKRFLASVLALSMIVVSGLPVFADGNITSVSENSATVSGDVVVNEPNIDITVPTATPVLINPFKIEASTKDGVDVSGFGSSISGNSVLSAAQEIENQSDVTIAVNVEALKVNVGNTYITERNAFPITVMSGSAAKAKNKSVYLYMAIASQDVKNAKGVPTLTTPLADADAFVDLLDSADTDKAVKSQIKNIKATQDYKAKATSELTGDALKKLEMAGGALKNAAIIKKGEKAFFQLRGDVNPNPTYTVNKVTTNDPWTAGEELNVSYKFTFEPKAND